MKKIIFTVLMFGVLNLVADSASATYCTAQVRVPAQNIQGNCMAGNCTAYVFPDWITASGQCNDGSYFTTETRTPATNLTGQCLNGNLWIRTDSQYYNWYYGRCSNGGQFYAPSTFVFGQTLNGSCIENGPFMVYTFTDYFSMQAQCLR